MQIYLAGVNTYEPQCKCETLDWSINFVGEPTVVYSTSSNSKSLRILYTKFLNLKQGIFLFSLHRYSNSPIPGLLAVELKIRRCLAETPRSLPFPLGFLSVSASTRGFSTRARRHNRTQSFHLSLSSAQLQFRCRR